MAIDSVPPLDALTSDWLPQAGLSHLPAVSNFWGGVSVAADVLGVENLTLPPYVQGGSCCELAVDGAPLTTETSRWSAYEVLREATTASGLRVRTATRLAFEANRLLLRVAVGNPTAAAVTTTLSVRLDPRIRKATSGWAWAPPRPEDADFTARTVGTPAAGLLVSDRASAAVTAFAASPGAALSASGAGGTAVWSLTVGAEATRTVDLVMAVGDTSTGLPLVAASDGQDVVDAADATLRDFAAVFAEAAAAWDRRWAQAFTPGNPHYSGSLPVLAAEATATGDAISRLYYMCVLSVLCCERTNLGPSFDTLLERTGPYSGFDRVYVTGAPEYSNTVTYFWDTSYCSVVLALLDPAMVRAQTAYWLAQDIHSCYAVETVQGGTVGPWYAANDLTVSTTVLNYLDYSGDTAYLRETVNGTSVLQLLTDFATHWTSLVPPGGRLADYGGDENLLEVLPPYTGQVAAFNAANVWLMRQAARLHEHAGSGATASGLRAAADALLPEVLALYVPGEGVWNCRHADGTVVPVRTVVDFAIGSNLLADHLTDRQQAEMKRFVTTELLVGDWLRALSSSDPQAPVDRPDHGTSGAYDSWPALSAQAFARMGDYAGFLDLLTAFSGVTRQGPFAQAHGAAADGGVVAGDVMTFNNLCGGKFADVVISDLFGYTPDGAGAALADAEVARGFGGTLSGVVFRGTGHTITSSRAGLSITETK